MLFDLNNGLLMFYKNDRYGFFQEKILLKTCVVDAAALPPVIWMETMTWTLYFYLKNVISCGSWKINSPPEVVS
jgi:hypothetical protein